MKIPTQFKVGVALLFLSIVTEVAFILYKYTFGFTLITFPKVIISTFISIDMLPVIFHIFLLSMIWKGKNWARIIVGFFALVGVVAIPFMPTNTPGYWVVILNEIFQVVGVTLLFLQPAASRFKKTVPANE